ncbi:ABC transporter permease [Clostridium sp. YIM B02505]|uniref:ABC transporter permease n=1 Tax=Clostridium yunnanense TaxID=2800325 RepID=A0ABS1EVE6_9CLOT|nr:ABC transporter permease [Clostridium yunnanense]MBK1813313.1 ABC transporter permease [Clostridium yunnanense]
MDRLLKVATLEIKRKRFMRELITALVTLCVLSFLSYYVSVYFSSELHLSTIPETFLQTIPYIILVLSSILLTQEFSNKTDKMIFTGIFRREEIIISKLISIIFISVICLAFYELTEVLGRTFEIGALLTHLCTFLIYSFTIGSFILMISTITSNLIITGVIGYVLYFDLILVLFTQALESKKSEVLSKVIEQLPFYIANTGFFAGHYTFYQGIIMISCGLLFFVITCVIINKKSL